MCCAAGKQAGEGSKINQSLSTLSRVIQILATANNAPNVFVPYRDSKLTYYLTNALGGNSKTCLIANVSPAIKNRAQTKSTLQFASQCKKIVTTPEIQKQVVHLIPPQAAVEADKKKITELQAENQKLKEMIRLQIEREHSAQSKSLEALNRERELSVQVTTLNQQYMKFHDLCQSQNKTLTEHETAKASRDALLAECGLLNPYDDASIIGDTHLWSAIAKFVATTPHAAAAASATAAAAAAATRVSVSVITPPSEVEQMRKQIESLTQALSAQRQKNEAFAADLAVEKWKLQQKLAKSDGSSGSAAVSTNGSAASSVASSISIVSDTKSTSPLAAAAEAVLAAASGSHNRSDSTGSDASASAIANASAAELQVMLQAARRDNKRRQNQLQALVHTLRSSEWALTHTRRAITRWHRIKCRNAPPPQPNGVSGANGTSTVMLAVANGHSARKSGAGVGLWTSFDARLMKRIEKIAATAEAERKQRRDSMSVSGASRNSIGASIDAGSGESSAAATAHGSTVSIPGLNRLVGAELASAFERNQNRMNKPILIVPAGSGSAIGATVPVPAGGDEHDADFDGEDETADAAADAMAGVESTNPLRLSVAALLESVDSECRDPALFNQLSPTKLSAMRQSSGAPLQPIQPQQPTPAASTAAAVEDKENVPVLIQPPMPVPVAGAKAESATDLGAAKNFTLSPIPAPTMSRVLSAAIGAVQPPIHASKPTLNPAVVTTPPLPANVLFASLPRLNKPAQIASVRATATAAATGNNGASL